ncbi:MAG TPA: hypothetical protein VGF67_28880 [Ktedonobacteraceae bacterium]
MLISRHNAVDHPGERGEARSGQSRLLLLAGIDRAHSSGLWADLPA